MAKNKGSRIGISLKCTECESKQGKSRTMQKNIYRTTKNRQNNSDRLELRKYCKFCDKHSIYREIK
uniref:Large ribosomal subunit protein bL33c n=1 Tax=Ishige okamurae TaxID=233772 RepID=A0A8E5XRF7_9PHAE|nr:ribosomal protein L33 [Ishige okamurae]QVJ99615.1 ribosomal protein L33 [Ishige okamurae]WAM64048.1 50S ribosomal protein L33 [Ishige okamurae]